MHTFMTKSGEVEKLLLLGLVSLVIFKQRITVCETYLIAKCHTIHFRIIYVIVFLITFKTTYICLSLLCLPLSGFPCLCISFSLLPHSGFFSVCLSLLCPPLLFFRVCLFVFLFSLYLASSVCLSFSSLSPSFWLVVCLSIYLSLLCLPLYGLLYLCLCPSVSLYLKTPITKSGCGSEA